MFPGGMTYAGHPLACATGVESIRVYLEDDIVGHAAAMGDLLGSSPSSPTAIRRSATCAAAACSTASSWCATARRVRRSCRSTPRAPTPLR